MGLAQVDIFAAPPREFQFNFRTPTTPSRRVSAVLATVDFGTGFNNISSYWLEGDVLSSYSDRWLRFESVPSFVLTHGPGVKTVRAKIRNASNVESDLLEASIVLQDVPEMALVFIDVLGPILVDAGTVPLQWTPSHDIDAWEIRVMESRDGGDREDGVLAVSGGAVSAGAIVEADAPVSSLLSVYSVPRSGSYFMKIYGRIDGDWYE